MALIASIDGFNRDIYLSIDTVGVDLNPIDVYKEMRTLRKNDETLRGYDVFLSAHGNDFKGGGKYTERYVKELLGTRIIPYDVTQILTIIGTIITDDGQEGVACFDRSPLTATSRVDINYIPPQVEVVRAEAELIALVNASYGEKVVVDAVNGVIGTTTDILGNYIGTNISPSSDLSDAKIIADRQGIDTFLVKGPLAITAGSFGAGYFFKGKSPITSQIAVDTAADVELCEFWTCYLSGVLDNGNIVRRGLIGTLASYDGYIDTCGFTDTITLGGASSSTFYNCFEEDGGSGIPPIISVGSGSHLNLVKYTGSLALKDKTGVDVVDADLESGILTIDSTCIAGSINVRGIGICIDNSGPGCTVNTVGLSSGDGSVRSAGYVRVNSGGGTGTTHPLGTKQFPVNNIADALVIAKAENVSRIHVHDTVVVQATDDISGFVMEGHSPVQSTISVLSGATTTNTRFTEINITAATLSNDGVIIERCLVGDVDGVTNT